MAGPEAALIERYRAARSDSGLAVLEGFHPLKHALRFGAEILEVVSSDPAAVEELAAMLAPDLVEALRGLVVSTPGATFSRLAPAEPPTGVLALARRPMVPAQEVLGGEVAAPVVLLEHPSHRGNVGAAIRVAAAAGAAGVLVLGTLDPWAPAAIRGGAGLQYALPVARCDAPPPSPRPLVALHPEGPPLEGGQVPADAILAFGTEREGLTAELLARAHGVFRLPMRPGVSSLNLATAVAATLYRLGPFGAAA